MPWYSMKHVANNVTSLDYKEDVYQCYFLWRFYHSSLLKEDYTVSELWNDAVSLSDDGKKLRDEVGDKIKEHKTEEINFAFFLALYHLELLINIEKTDIALIERSLREDILSGTLHHPHIIGRELYNKFNDNDGYERTSVLGPQDSLRLIEKTTKGIYQLGNYLTGPLGLLISDEWRWVPPTLTLPLWHCSDTGCMKVHRVKLKPPMCTAVKIKAALEEKATEIWGNYSEWFRGLERLCFKELHPMGRRFYDLAVFLGDCIHEKERDELFKSVVDSESGKIIREIIQMPPRRKSMAKGSPEDLCKRFSTEEKLQLLLCINDDTIIDHINTTNWNKDIDVKKSEVRKARHQLERFYYRDSSSELSSYGMRSTIDEPVLFLVELIHRSYLELSMMSDLEWKIKKEPHKNTQVKLMEYIEDNDPRDVVNDLVLSTKGVTEKFAEWMKISVDKLERHRDPTGIVLWNMGFNEPRHDYSTKLTKQRLEEFNTNLLELSEIRDESDRARIRSKGVNLFVSIEEFIENFVGYNIWLLASDHFLETKLMYNGEKARKEVSQILGKEINKEGNVFAWKDDGENSLGVLNIYLNEMMQWVRSLENADRRQIERPEQDLPHYHDDPIRAFTLRHQQMWADTDLAQLNSYVQKLQRIVDLLNAADIASIRNGLDHKRDAHKFPSLDRMLAFVVRFRQALETAELNRFYPKWFWLEETQHDRYKRYSYVYRDYSGMELKLKGPAKTMNRGITRYHGPVLIAPCNLIGEANSHLIIRVQENSEDLEYWKGYPIRRRIAG